MIDMSKLKTGDTFYAPIRKFEGPFFTGWKIVICTVTKTNPKSILISFNKETQKRPQRIKIGPSSLYKATELEVWKELLKGHEKSKNREEYYNKKAEKQCIKKIKQLTKED